MNDRALPVVREDGTVTGDFVPSLFPLTLHMVGCATAEEMNANVDATIARGYTGIIDLLDTESGAVSIVGSGPSLRETWKDLTGDVFAINQAVGFLLSKGVVPKWAMLWDAADIIEQFAEPHPDVTYLVAARCHPKVFERLKDCNVRVWFAGGDHNIAEYMVAKKLNDPLVNGGSAGVTRAMYLATVLGYRELHIFGADSSYSDDGNTHVVRSLVPEKNIFVWVGNGDGKKCFRTTPEWCSQVNEFRDIYHLFSHPAYSVGIDVYGEGMLPHMATLMRMRKEAGKLWNADGSPFAPSEDVQKSYDTIQEVEDACK
jgi:hypothetical protein